MADAQRREVFAFIPSGQPGNSSVAFVLPDSFSNPHNVTMRKRDGRRYVRPEHNCGGNRQQAPWDAETVFS